MVTLAISTQNPGIFRAEDEQRNAIYRSADGIQVTIPVLGSSVISLTSEAGGDLLIHEVRAKCEFGQVVALVSAANPLSLVGRFGATSHTQHELVGVVVRTDLHPSLAITAAGGLVFYGEGFCGWVFVRDGLRLCGDSDAITYANLMKVTDDRLEMMNLIVFKSLTGYTRPLKIEFNV